MTFNEIILKMFKHNFRRYLLFFLCNSFTVMIFFVYASLYTNRDFNDVYQVDPSISSNLIAPGLGIVLFSVFLVIYAQSAYMKNRKKDFGLFLVLGMTNKDIKKIILVENAIIAAASIIIGIAAGTQFSYLFFCIVSQIINTSLHFSLSLRGYLITILFFAIIYCVVILFSLVLTSNYKIIRLLKDGRKSDKNSFNGAVWLFIGGAIILLSVVVIMLRKENNMALLVSMLLCFSGIMFILSNVPNIYDFCKTKLSRANNKSSTYNHIVVTTDLKYSIGQSKKIMLIITILISITIFFISFALKLMSGAMGLAIENCPFHVEYTQLYDKNKISEKELNEIIRSSATPLNEMKKVDFLTTRYITILSSDILNKNFGTSIKVEDGHFLSLFPVVPDDGYVHDYSELSSLDISSNSKENVLLPNGKLIKVLFNVPVSLSNNHFIIVNEKEYSLLAQNNSNIKVNKGVINLINFNDWRKTGQAVEQLSKALRQYNEHHTESYFATRELDNKLFSPTSRIQTYEQSMQSASFLLFLLTFVGVLFFFSSTVVIHFHLQSKKEYERGKLLKLLKIGITSSEFRKIVTKELSVLFYTPYIMAIIASLCFYVEVQAVQGNIYDFMFPIAVGLLGLLFQALYLKWYKSWYIRGIWREVGRY